MDQRRVIAFVALSMLVLIVHGMFFAPKPKPNKNVPAAVEAETLDAKELAEKIADDTAEEGIGNANLPAADLPAEIEAQAEVEQQYVTLGSIEKDSPYRLLVTFTNSGAAVRRIELTSSRFSDLHDRSGYLGHLELVQDDQTGLLVKVVGEGTPAQQAGIQAGDRITAVQTKEELLSLSSLEEFEEVLSHTKPGRDLSLQVAQGGAAPSEVVVKLTRRPLEVIRPEYQNVLMRGEELSDDFPSPPSFQFAFEKLGNNRIAATAADIEGAELSDANWEIAEQDENSVTFRRVLSEQGLEVKKRYFLEPVPAEEIANDNYPAYDLKLEISVRNLGAEQVDFAYRLDGPNGLPVEGWWYSNKVGRNWGAAGIRDVVAQHVGNETVSFNPTDIANDKVEPMQGNPLVYAGIDAQYFSAILIPQKENIEDHWIDEVRSLQFGPKPKARSNEGRYANVTCRLISQPQTLESGESLQHSYSIFAGPKRPELLQNYTISESNRYSLNNVMYYGWFSTVSKTMLGILHFFYGVVGNYGIAIILLTVLVRSCMFPISRKQAQSMAKMQELRPEMDKIKEKYKSDMQKQSEAMQELYRKHGVNPVAGCLPMFIQLPIFLGLYRSLMVDVELRQAPLLGDAIRWCSNLAAPDMFFNWASFMPGLVTNYLGPYLNVLPLVTIGLFILQQKMFMPEATNEQAALQQKIMKYMMVFMGFLFFKVASGLCLYFIASSIWGIAERKMLPKPTTPDGGLIVTEPKEKKPTPRASSNGQAKNKRSQRTKKKKR